MGRSLVSRRLGHRPELPPAVEPANLQIGDPRPSAPPPASRGAADSMCGDVDPGAQGRADRSQHLTDRDRSCRHGQCLGTSPAAIRPRDPRCQRWQPGCRPAEVVPRLPSRVRPGTGAQIGQAWTRPVAVATSMLRRCKGSTIGSGEESAAVGMTRLTDPAEVPARAPPTCGGTILDRAPGATGQDEQARGEHQGAPARRADHARAWSWPIRYRGQPTAARGGRASTSGRDQAVASTRWGRRRGTSAMAARIRRVIPWPGRSLSWAVVRQWLRQRPGLPVDRRQGALRRVEIGGTGQGSSGGSLTTPSFRSRPNGGTPTAVRAR